MHLMATLAYSYVRFSSLEQKDGDSERRQDSKFSAYCKRKRLTPAPDSFKDRGRSGFKGEHLGDTGELRRFLKLVEAGDIQPGSVLVVESLDRLGRQEVESALRVFLDILDAGIRIVTLGDGEGEREYVKGGGFIPLMLSLVEMARAHGESQRKSELVGAAMANKQALARELMKPMGNVCPLWLTLKKGWRSFAQDGSAYEEIPERGDVVRQIFQWAIEGYGKGVIAKKLNERDIESFKAKNEKLKAKGHAQAWGTSSVDKILKNRATIGEYLPRTVQGLPNGTPRHERREAGEPIAGYFPMVVSVETFYEAQAAIDGLRTAKATRQIETGNVWQGIAKCEKCGASMQLVNKGAPPKGGRYLRCGNTRKGVCQSRTVRLEQADEVFRGMLLRLDTLALVKDESAQLEKALRVAEGRRSEAKRRLDALEQRLLEAPESHTIGRAIGSAEADVKATSAEVRRIKTELAAESAIGWDEFLRRLDLVSYEGRMKANALMKRLGVVVLIGPSGYGITQNGQAKFGMDYREGEGAGYWRPGYWGTLPTFLPVADVPATVAAEDADQARYDAIEDEGQSSDEY